VDTADCSAMSLSNVVVEDIANLISAGDRVGVFLAFGKSGSFTAREDRIVADALDKDCILGQRGDMLDNAGDVSRANAFLKIFCFWFSRAYLIRGRYDGQVEGIVEW